MNLQDKINLIECSWPKKYSFLKPTKVEYCDPTDAKSCTYMSIRRLAIALNTDANSGIERRFWAKTLAFFSFSLDDSSGFFCPLLMLPMGKVCGALPEYLKGICEASNKAININAEKTEKQTL